MAAADLLPGEHAQREVLRQVVTGQHRVPEQRGDAVHEDGQHEEQEDGRGLAGPLRDPAACGAQGEFS